MNGMQVNHYIVEQNDVLKTTKTSRYSNNGSNETVPSHESLTYSGILTETKSLSQFPGIYFFHVLFRSYLFQY